MNLIILGSRDVGSLEEACISLDSISPCIREISRRYPISVSGVFGSVARGTNGRESDIDVFAQFDEGHTFLDEERFREEVPGPQEPTSTS